MSYKPKEVPILYRTKEECCGCGMCRLVCLLKDGIQQSAITMISDEEGFAYPQIDPQKCIFCFRCIKVCPIL